MSIHGKGRADVSPAEDLMQAAVEYDHLSNKTAELEAALDYLMASTWMSGRAAVYATRPTPLPATVSAILSASQLRLLAKAAPQGANTVTPQVTL